MSDPLLARAWDEAAARYDEYFVPRFAPWVATAVSALDGIELPPGPVVVPCCGTFPELPALRNRLPGRQIVGIDLSTEMIALARRRVAGDPSVRLAVGDASAVRPHVPEPCAAVISVFGLQQLPDPVAALTEWTGSLAPGGCLSVVFWPSNTETDGPFATLDRVLDSEAEAPAWEGELAPALGRHLVSDEPVAHELRHPDADAYWTALTDGGPLRATALRRGAAWSSAMRQKFVAAGPSGPWVASPVRAMDRGPRERLTVRPVRAPTTCCPPGP